MFSCFFKQVCCHDNLIFLQRFDILLNDIFSTDATDITNCGVLKARLDTNLHFHEKITFYHPLILVINYHHLYSQQ